MITGHKTSSTFDNNEQIKMRFTIRCKTETDAKESCAIHLMGCNRSRLV